MLNIGSRQLSVSNEQATAILKQFGILVTDPNAIGSKVYDESLLYHPKEEIISAIVAILNGPNASDQQNCAREAAPVLALFFNLLLARLLLRSIPYDPTK